MSTQLASALCAAKGVTFRYGVDVTQWPELLRPFDRIVIATGAAYRFGLGPMATSLLDRGVARWPLVRNMLSAPALRDWFYHRARTADRRGFPGPRPPRPEGGGDRRRAHRRQEPPGHRQRLRGRVKTLSTVKDLKTFWRTISHNLDAGSLMLTRTNHGRLGTMFRSTLRLIAAAGDRRHHGFGTLRRVGAGLPQRPVRQQRSPVAVASTGTGRKSGSSSRRGRKAQSRRDTATRSRSGSFASKRRSASSPARSSSCSTATSSSKRSCSACRAVASLPRRRARPAAAPQPPQMQPQVQPPPAPRPGTARRRVRSGAESECAGRAACARHHSGAAAGSRQPGAVATGLRRRGSRRARRTRGRCAARSVDARRRGGDRSCACRRRA